mgnify:CR=1 FL=1
MVLKLPKNLEIEELNICNKGLRECPDLSRYTKIRKLDISSNKITNLDYLPSTLEELNCNYNKITQLDNLPCNLKELECNYNKIKHLDNLPLSLKELGCIDNPLEYNFKPTLENIRNYNANTLLLLEQNI